ncbi:MULTISPECIES: hypothetical protein [Dyella]|uniref:Uncharacterized protein n=2 Tax=Dyella TaxID=231454 RepID=A0A4R0YRA6_9GAMM|nr:MULTISPECIES: hypothetical protein [Dyella]TBR40593.1 hypothetical protein EYV96_10690 [Dyella terrae]TCI11825.1 hypothetical protein EZM97_00180 [Dyella soli]
MTTLGYTLVTTFAALCIVGAGALIWALFFSIRMTFQFEQRGVAYSRATLWNPMNAILRPALLSDAGRQSRRLALKGLLVFAAAYVCAGALGLAIKWMA